MSAKIMGEVWELALPREQKYVLLCLADHADHEGNHVFPSLGLIEWKTEYSQRQIRRILECLESAGVLVAVRRANGLVTEYRIALAGVARKPAYFKQHGRPRCEKTPDILTKTPDILTHADAKTPDILAENPGHFDNRTPDILTKTPDILAASPIRAIPNRHRTVNCEPSLEERGARAPENGVTHPGDAQHPGDGGRPQPPLPPTAEEVTRYLAEIGQPGHHAALFHAYYAERGWTTGQDRQPIRDWRAKLRTWVAREAQFAPRNAPKSPPTPPGQSALVNAAHENAARWRAIKEARAAPGGDTPRPETEMRTGTERRIE